MDQRRVHVIILNWNGREVLGECLESLMAVADPPLDITVVDNGSTDSSTEIVRQGFPGIGLIENGKFNPSLALCTRIARALGKTLDQLFWEGGAA